MKLEDLKPNPRNPRKISSEKLGMLGQALDHFGDLSGIVYNRRTGHLAGGHQRLKRLPATTEIVIDQRYDEPTRTGTVAEGYIVWKGERFRYREVDWDETNEKAANVAANKHGGEFDLPLLNEFLLEIDNANFDMDLTGFSKFELDELLGGSRGEGEAGEPGANPYTKKIEPPIYEPKGERPKISELFETDKMQELVAEINENASLDDDEKEFLKLAATRHVKFDYEKIAEFYAHASPELQEAIENSAMVIIDFDKAIEKGFVRVSEAMAEAYRTGSTVDVD